MRECSIDGCDRKHYGRGMCKKHYCARWRAENPESVREHKARYHAENRERERERQARWYAENRERELERKALYYAENRESVLERQARYYAENPEKRRERDARYRAENREKVLDRQALYYAENRESVLEQQARYYLENRGKVRERHARYRAENPEVSRRLNDRRRARKAAAFVEDFTREEIYERDGWICGICEEPIDQSLSYPDPMSASLDHVIPLARGGEHSRANAQAAHLRCNVRKKDSVAA